MKPLWQIISKNFEMNSQNTIQKLEYIKQNAPKIERNTLPFYQQWQKGGSMAMKGNLDVNLSEDTIAYIVILKVY